jgi:uncharacterized protein (DUF2236 family)
VITPVVLPWPLHSSLEAATRALFDPGDRSSIDFLRPAGEAALVSPESVSWRVFKNPLSLFIGGVTAVIMELAEPRVRTGIWEHTTFRLDPIRRLRRTGLAAMVTIYGARSTAEPMIARIRRMHEMVTGTTVSGEAYRANDSELLNWVQARPHTAFFRLITCMCSRSLRRSVTAIMPRVFRPRVSTGPRAHRHLKSSLKCCSMQCPAGWSARTLYLSFSPSCARRRFCRFC